MTRYPSPILPLAIAIFLLTLIGGMILDLRWS